MIATENIRSIDLEKTEWAIKNGQSSRDPDNIGHTKTRDEDKQKHKNTTQYRKLKRWVTRVPLNTTGMNPGDGEVEAVSASYKV
jgi:hypothetical protein